MKSFFEWLVPLSDEFTYRHLRRNPDLRRKLRVLYFLGKLHIAAQSEDENSL